MARRLTATFTCNTLTAGVSVVGVVIAATPAGVTGRVHLKGGGRYDDVYANTPNGWRFSPVHSWPRWPPGPGGRPSRFGEQLSAPRKCLPERAAKPLTH